MRAWVPKKRDPQQAADSDGSSPRRTRVRTRLVVGIALSALAVAGAGTPGLVAAGRVLSEDQELIRLAELNRRTVSLAHAVADERDALLVHLAAGRNDDTGRAFATERVRVDQRVRELRADDATPDSVVEALEELPRHRRQALSGNAEVQAVHAAYTEVVRALGEVAGSLARALPARAEQTPPDAVGPAGPAHALPFLVRATEHASATRGLLLAALADPDTDDRTAAAAQQARLREQAAYADFRQLAGAEVRDSYAKTVSGPDVTDAERLLARLTDQAELSAADRKVDRKRLESVLTARIQLMRSVAATLSAEEAERLAGLRDDDVTALQIHLALVAAALLLAAASGLHTARSVVRPLAVLRRGTQRVSSDPEHEHPLGFTGRNDEFADVARAFNRLHAHLRERGGAPATAGDRADSPDAETTGQDTTTAGSGTPQPSTTTRLRVTGPYLVDPSTLDVARREPADGSGDTPAETAADRKDPASPAARQDERQASRPAPSAVGRIPAPRTEQPATPRPDAPTGDRTQRDTGRSTDPDTDRDGGQRAGRLGGVDPEDTAETSLPQA